MVVILVHWRDGIDFDVNTSFHPVVTGRIFSRACLTTSLSSTFSATVPPLPVPGPSQALLHTFLRLQVSRALNCAERCPIVASDPDLTKEDQFA